MTKLIAVLSLSAISIGLTFGNYWFTFGLWPKSWISFVLFAVGFMIISSAITAVTRDE